MVLHSLDVESGRLADQRTLIPAFQERCTSPFHHLPCLALRGSCCSPACDPAPGAPTPYPQISARRPAGRSRRLKSATPARPPGLSASGRRPGRRQRRRPRPRPAEGRRDCARPSTQQRAACAMHLWRARSRRPHNRAAPSDPLLYSTCACAAWQREQQHLRRLVVLYGLFRMSSLCRILLTYAGMMVARAGLRFVFPSRASRVSVSSPPAKCCLAARHRPYHQVHQSLPTRSAVSLSLQRTEQSCFSLPSITSSSRANCQQLHCGTIIPLLVPAHV